MNKSIFISITFILLAFSISVFSHGGKKHKKDSIKQDSIVVNTTTSVEAREHTSHHLQNDNVKAGLEDFPSLHPLIVHFAIALIIIAALVQCINVFTMRKEFSWVVTGLIVIGFITAYLASSKFHPHTHGLSEHAKQVLAMHDHYADWTLYLAGLGAALQILNLFVFKSQRWAVGIVAIVLIASSYCVTHAGHYGAQLVHIEGVGPQGKFLETDHHH